MEFRLRCLDAQGALVQVPVQAASLEGASLEARRRGLTVLSAQRSGGRPWSRARSFDLALFTQELLALLKAGLNLLEALEALAQGSTRPEARSLLDEILGQLRQGERFSVALTRLSTPLPELFVATIKSAERTGDLIPALERYLGYARQADMLRKKIVSAAIYPLLLVGAGSLVTLFLLGYVVPRFASVYQDRPDSLPFLSGLLIRWGTFLDSHSAAMGLAGLGIAAVLGLLFSRAAVRARLGLLLQRLPALGEGLRKFQLTRFYRTVGMLLDGGIPALAALALARGLLPPGLRMELDGAMKEIEAGQPLAAAFARHGLTTPVALRLLQVGEQSGRLADMLEAAASFHEEETARRIDMVTRLLEPLLMAGIGLGIGGIVVLLYMPIFDLAGSLQ